MALLSFPDQIEVVIGSGWTAKAYISEDDILILNKVTGTIYTEDGTETPNSSTNRLRIEFKNIGGKGTITVRAPATDFTGSFNTAGKLTAINVDDDYTFKEIWNMTGLGTMGDITGYQLLTTYATYNDDVFKSLQMYTPPSPGQLSLTGVSLKNLTLGKEGEEDGGNGGCGG